MRTICSSYHVEKQVCDKVLATLRTQHGTYWDGSKAVLFPEGGLAKPVGFFSPPPPTLANLDGDMDLYKKRVAKVRSGEGSLGGWVDW